MKFNYVILFRLSTICEESFSIPARLIEKIEKRENFEAILNEVYYREVGFVRNESRDNDRKQLVNSLLYAPKQFLINCKDELRKAVSENEEIFYVFLFDKKEKLNEKLTNFQYFFVLKQKFERCILLINSSSTESDYFRISHYLYFETLWDSDSVFYKDIDEMTYKRLQQNNVGALTEFIPLIHINMETYKLLSQRVGEIWNREGEVIRKTEDEYIGNVFNKIWESCVALLDYKEKNKIIYVSEFNQCRGLSLLALYFYCAYMRFMKKDIADWDEAAFRLLSLEITDGILQLVENVCLHSEQKEGYLSFSYVDIDKDRKFKVTVIDYANSDEEKTEGSILKETFYNHLKEDDEFKKYFRYAEIKDFFEPVFVEGEKLPEVFYGNYWDDYFYNKSENAAFHYGLQVFASVVRGYKGEFYVRSGYQYRYNEKQTYEISYEDKAKRETEEKILDAIEKKQKRKFGFPGTYFEITIPVYLISEQKSVGFNSKISDHAFEEILKYEVKNVGAEKQKELFQLVEKGIGYSQIEKEEQIKRVKVFLSELKKDGLLLNNKYLISRIDFKDFHSGQVMEFFCKALMLFIKENGEGFLKIAIVNCSDECMLEFVRWFLIFYDKQNICKEMKYVEIYMVGEDCREDFLLSGESLGISQGRIEKVCFSKGVYNQRQRIISQAIWRMVKNKTVFNDGEFEIIPYDVIVDIVEGEKIFEAAVLEALNTDLQSMDFGCKVDHCHVRIGSKIHISDDFYEAHSLFHSNYYTSRFALLLAKKVQERLGEENYRDKPIILVGYETYSELLLCEIKKILKKTYDYKDVNHIVYDVGSNDEFRLWKTEYENAFYINIVPINSTLSTHNKMISIYKKYKMKEDNILANFAVILIRDTQWDDGVNRRCAEGAVNSQRIENNLTQLEKHYWEGIDENAHVVYTKLTKKEIDYLIQIENHWEVPLECSCCYPKIARKERPLIETNKASVVPTFMVGIKQESEQEEKKHSIINEYRKQLNLTRIAPEIINEDVLRYRHFHRNGNDYRFYIKSEKLFEQIEGKRKKDLEQWCDQVKNKLKNSISKYMLVEIAEAFQKEIKMHDDCNRIVEEQKQRLVAEKNEISYENAKKFLKDLENEILPYATGKKQQVINGMKVELEKIEGLSKMEKIRSYDIIVSPVHHSNATWIDQVTENIFENMPAILHFDVQKEFRDNMRTKYSNLTSLYKNLCASGGKFEINFHFVDDTIISGRTFHRAKTLIQSLFPEQAFDKNPDNKIRVNLFKSVILLFNRMSTASKLQYVEEDMFFSYINICIPNLRNHEDACIMCKLVSDMNHVKRRAAMNKTAEFFEKREIKHMRLEEQKYEKDTITEEEYQRHYKRLYCTHRIFEETGEMGNLRNNSQEIRKVMLMLLTEVIKKEVPIKDIEKNIIDEQMEWIISYLKIFSRPVIIFRKSFLEAYFYLAISMIELIVKAESDDELDTFKKFYVKFCKKSKKKKELQEILLKTLLGGLAKVKSNYILRVDNIITVFEWYSQNISMGKNKDTYQKFTEWYVMHIKRLLELSGDETKSLWLEKLLLESREWGDDEVNEKFKVEFDIQSDFGKYLYLENTRLIYDAVSDLKKNFCTLNEKDNRAEEEEKEDEETFLEQKVQAFIQSEVIDLNHYYLHNFFALLAMDRDYCLRTENEKNTKESYNEASKKRVCAMVELYRHLNQNEKKRNKNSDNGNNQQIEKYYHDLLEYMGKASGADRVSLFGADEKEDRLKEVKAELKKICEDNEIKDEELDKMLNETGQVRRKLYRIASFDSNEKNNREETDKIKKEKRELYHAKNLLEYCDEDHNLHLGETLTFDWKEKKVLLKIHNNWTELQDICEEKEIRKIQVEPFFFYFDFSNQEEGEFGIIRGMRNILTFRDSLVKKIEEDFNNNLIQLTMSSQRKANDLSSDRAAGHTKMDEIKTFFETNREYFVKENPAGLDKKRLMGDALKLLADSYCSHKFTSLYPSAEEPIKIDQIDMSTVLDDYIVKLQESCLFLEEYTFSMIEDSNKNSCIAKINFEIEERDIEVLNIDFKESLAVFLVLMIQNALKYGRLENDECEIDIYIEGDFLVIQNTIKSGIDIDEMRENLMHIPEGKNAGISLWVIDQCIREKKRKYYWKKHVDQRSSDKNKMIYGFKKLIEKFEELEKSCIRIESPTDGGKVKIMLPIIVNKEMESYEYITI